VYWFICLYGCCSATVQSAGWHFPVLPVFQNAESLKKLTGAKEPNYQEKVQLVLFYEL
jgi:hypothetical protein